MKILKIFCLFGATALFVSCGNKDNSSTNPSAQGPSQSTSVRTEDLIGRSFDSINRLKQELKGYTFVSLLQQQQWPATVTRIETGENEITFKVNGTPQRYKGYDGFTLQAIFLDPGNGLEAVAIFKSKEKKAS